MRRTTVGLCTLILLVACMLTPAAASATSNGVMSWGENFWGQLGTGTFGKKTAPITLREPTGVLAVSAGGTFSLALIEGGTVRSWGSNVFGELGIGTKGGESARPVEVHNLSTASAIAAGEDHALALLASGHVKAWGSNPYGQLGIGNTEEQNEPVEIAGLSHVTAIAAGGGASLALLENGHVMAWGQNNLGELGDGTTTGPEECSAFKTPCHTTPGEVEGLEEVSQIAMGEGHALALLKNGHVMAWGSNSSGELGDGTTTTKSKPVEVEGLEKVKAVSAGNGYSLALLENGTVVAWGGNESGELGDNNSGGPEKCGSVPCSRKPVEVTGLSKVTAISASYTHSLALVEGGTVRAWGENAEGDLGVGKLKGPEECSGFPCSRVPVKVSEITQNAVGISAGEDFNLVTGPPGPILGKIRPTSGPPTGGTEVTLTGYNFVGVTKVKFGSTEATFTTKSPNEIVATAPAGSGKVQVNVTTSGGTIPVSGNDRYRYATAEAPEFGRCVEVAKGTGEFSSASCTTEMAGGSFKWKPGVEKAGFALIGGEAVLETTGKEKITCKAESGSGEYTSPKSVANVLLTLTGCEHGGAKCTSAGAGEGELVTSTLEGELGWRNKTSLQVGLDLAPSEPGSFAEGKCGSTKVEISGSVIGVVQTDEMLKFSTLTFEQKEGKQKPTHFSEGEPDVLEMLLGGKLEQTGLSVSITQTSEEKVEVNTSV
jgi:alpha-tubulin suppressor-like RCC1 family protein